MSTAGLCVQSPNDLADDLEKIELVDVSGDCLCKAGFCVQSPNDLVDDPEKFEFVDVSSVPVSARLHDNYMTTT